MAGACAHTGRTRPVAKEKNKRPSCSRVKNAFTRRMPKGWYFIGDPLAFVGKKTWASIKAKGPAPYEWTVRPRGVTKPLKGVVLAVWPFGLVGSDKKPYHTASGYLGAVPMRLYQHWDQLPETVDVAHGILPDDRGNPVKGTEGGIVHHFTEPWDATVSNGVVWFGKRLGFKLSFEKG